MKIKNKNIIQAIIQAVSLILLFPPCVYTEEIWLDISGRKSHYLMTSEDNVSFIRKLTSLEEGRFLGILAVVFMVLLMVLLIIQIAKNTHINTIPGIALGSIIFNLIYAFGCTMDSASSRQTAYYEYVMAFGLLLILALQITILIIGLISNARIKANGILEEEKMPLVFNSISNAEELEKYKVLLDKGIITQEEFDAKKKQLLGL